MLGFHLIQNIESEIGLSNLKGLQPNPLEERVCKINSLLNYYFAEIEALIFFTFFDNLAFLADIKNLSKPPL